VDQFLEQLGRIFEIVVYTADSGMTVFPVLDALDPNGFIMYRLVRDGNYYCFLWKRTTINFCF
jgi:TFIIF-interacting CTD phosphatase-like protein